MLLYVDIFFKIVKDLYDVTSKITVRKNFNFKKSLAYINGNKRKKENLF